MIRIQSSHFRVRREESTKNFIEKEMQDKNVYLIIRQTKFFWDKYKLQTPHPYKHTQLIITIRKTKINCEDHLKLFSVCNLAMLCSLREAFMLCYIIKLKTSTWTTPPYFFLCYNSPKILKRKAPKQFKEISFPSKENVFSYEDSNKWSITFLKSFRALICSKFLWCHQKALKDILFADDAQFCIIHFIDNKKTLSLLNELLFIFF